MMVKDLCHVCTNVVYNVASTFFPSAIRLDKNSKFHWTAASKLHYYRNTCFCSKQPPQTLSRQITQSILNI